MNTPSTSYDFIIIGSGVGGGVLAYAMRDSGARVLIIERGERLPQEPENWSPKAVFKHKRYKNAEDWYSADAHPFQPGVHYYVGGNTKVYGAALPRFRRQDFETIEHEGGLSPAWPVTYAQLEPYYEQAEQLFYVHGNAGEDPCEPERSSDYPYPAVPHEPYIEELGERLQRQGLHPYHLPMGVDLRDGGRCIRCKTCDGFPCQVHAKADVEVCAIQPAMESQNITLMTGTFARRLLTDPAGKHLTGVEVVIDGELKILTAGVYVIACGAVNSAALLLRSADAAHPAGLSNSSGQVGRNYMMHNNTALMAIDPRHINPTVFQKTMAINDYYYGAPGWAYPLGNIQMLGKLQVGMLTASKPLVPGSILQAMADRSVDWWVMSEDLPDPQNRVVIGSDGSIRIHWKPNNRATHEHLIKKATEMMRAAGFPLVLVERLGIETNSHQCGTLRMGNDPQNAVLDPLCHSYDLSNLFAVDSSFFSSSSAMNPALTIAAQALRVADHLMGKPLRESKEKITGDLDLSFIKPATQKP